MGDALLFAALSLTPVAVMVPTVTVLSAFPRVTRRGTGFLLAVAHTGLMLAAMALAPLWILSDPDPMYANVYPPYFLVPGPHIWVPSARFFGATVAPWLDEFLAPRPVGILCIVVGPGLVGLLVGGAQWYLIGAVWDRIDRLLPRNDTTT